jgi:hypothetical protein
MKYGTPSLHFIKRYRSAMEASFSRLLSRGAPDDLLSLETVKYRHPWIRMHSRVLRRDGYRCRGCDRKAEAGTLGIHLIRPDSQAFDEILTLCQSCLAVAGRLKEPPVSVPHFLVQLWCQLHAR